MQVYQAALEGTELPIQIGASRTVAEAALMPWSQPIWTVLHHRHRRSKTARRKRSARAGIFSQNFREAHGDLPLYRTIGGRRVAAHAGTYAAHREQKGRDTVRQRNFLNTLRSMFRWAMKEGRIPDDPPLGVTREKVKTMGYKTWSEDHIARFEAGYPIGTKGRLAFAAIYRPAPRRRCEDGKATCP